MEYNKNSRCDLDNFKHEGWFKSVSILFMHGAQRLSIEKKSLLCSYNPEII